MSVKTKQVDYRDHQDGLDFVRLLGEYARFEGITQPPDFGQIFEQLRRFPTSFSVLAYSAANQSVAIGLVNCFFGLSTFTGRRVVNVHDVIVTQDHRGRGVSGALLEAVEAIAIANDCCRLTLEVYADNAPALRAYHKHGFSRDPAHPETDIFFLRKTLS